MIKPKELKCIQTTTMNEQELIRQLQDHDLRHRAFRVLVQEYSQRIYWHIRRFVHFHEDADDLLQDVFIKIWENIDKFQGKSTLYTWIYRIATNESLLYLRKLKRMQLVPNENEQGELLLENELRADPFFTGDEAQAKLLAAIDTLPEKQKAVFLLRYYEEMKYDEISNVLETSVGALKANYHHAVKKIEDLLKKEVV